MQGRAFDYAILAAGVAAVSTAAILIREADAPALVIAAYRLGLASVPLLGASFVRQRPVLAATLPYTLLNVLAGIFLALHFGFWIASVKQTSIVTSVVLVTAQPLFVALLSGPLLGERTSRAAWLGIALASTGAAVMVADDLGEGADTLVGDLYAILGAVFASGYFLVGRGLRTGGQDWLSYVTLAYSTAALVLIGAAVVGTHDFTGYSLRTYAFLLVLAVVPQLIGHTALNRSLGYLPAVSVTIAVLGEPVGATIFSIVLLDEVPTLPQLTGAVLVLAGVYTGLRASRGPTSRSMLRREKQP